MKKLELNKKTIAGVNWQELKKIKAGGEAAFKACWENLWTLYYCDLIYTGIPN